MTDSDFESLAGQLLLAVPSMSDPYFSQTVTLLCEHSEEGAMGLVINQPTKLLMAEVFESVDITGEGPAASEAVYYGGPVSLEQGFLLHSDTAQTYESSHAILPGISLTASRDIIVALAENRGPMHWRFVLGYAGWSAGQLEDELSGNSWLVTPATSNLVLHTEPKDILRLAAAQLGININRLGSTSGHA